LSTILFSCALEYVIRQLNENEQRLEPNGTHQLLICADDTNLLDKN